MVNKQSSLPSLDSSSSFDVISTYGQDPFLGNLSTPITASNLTKKYLTFLPAYQKGLSPLLRGISIGFVHGYFLLGPFVKCGPLRESEVTNFLGFLSTISLILVLTLALALYGIVTFTKKQQPLIVMSKKNLGNLTDTRVLFPTIDIFTSKGWQQFTSGFIVGGFGGTSVAYILVT